MIWRNWGKRRHEKQLAGKVRTANSMRLAGRFVEAERGYQNILDASAEHPLFQIDALHGLGLVRAEQGRFGEGFEYLRRAMGILEQHGWQETRRAATTLNNIAGLRWKEGNRDAACAIFEKALSLLHDVVSSDSRDFEAVLAILENLGVHYTTVRRYDDAERVLKDGLRRVDAHVSQHPANYVSLLKYTTALYEAQGQTCSARALLTNAVKRCERDLGRTRGELATILNVLGHLERRTGGLESAERHLQRALSILDRAKGHHQDAIADACAGLGLLSLNRGDPLSAAGFFERQLATTEAMANPQPHERVVAINNVGVALRESGRLAEAETMFSRALDIARPLVRDRGERESVHELNLANVLKNFSQLRQCQGRLDDAVAMATEAQSIARREMYSGIAKARQILDFTDPLLSRR